MFGKKKQPVQNQMPQGGQAPQATPQAVQPAQNPKQAQQSASKAQEALKQGSVGIVDIIAPSSVEVDFKHIRVGDTYYRTFFVVDYPRQVSPNWLSILIDYKETMNISMFIYPVE